LYEVEEVVTASRGAGLELRRKRRRGQGREYIESPEEWNVPLGLEHAMCWVRFHIHEAGVCEQTPKPGPGNAGAAGGMGGSGAGNKKGPILIEQIRLGWNLGLDRTRMGSEYDDDWSETEKFLAREEAKSGKDRERSSDTQKKEDGRPFWVDDSFEGSQERVVEYGEGGHLGLKASTQEKCLCEPGRQGM
jgi:hypothetical protein